MGTRWRIEFVTRYPSAPNSETWKVGIFQSKLDILQKYGHTAKQARILLVKEVLTEPQGIFQGWSRPDTDRCFVYVGNPGHDYHSPTI